MSLVLVPHRMPHEQSSRETLSRTLEVVGAASQGGFHACFFPEHHLRDDDYITSPLTVAAMAAGRWPELRVGASVLLPALHNPLTMAEQLATLDVASGGRLYLVGVGLGAVEREYRAIGVPYGEMLDRFMATIDVLCRLWRGEEVTGSVGSLRVEGAVLSPGSEQPELPLAIGAMSEKGIRRAARLGLPWMTDPMHPLEVLDEWSQLYWSEAGDRGRIILMRQAWPAATLEEVEQEWWPHAQDQIFGFSLTHDRLRGDGGLAAVETPDDLRFDDFRSRFLLGPPDSIVEQAQALAARFGASDVIVRVGFGSGPSHDAVMAAVASLGAALR